MEPMYMNTAALIGVVNADTLDVEVNLGYGVFLKIRVQLHGINVPDDDNEEAKAFVFGFCSADDFILKTFGTDKYGRYVAELWRDSKCLNTLMVDRKLAEKYEG